VLPADLTDAEQLATVEARCHDRGAPVDVLVNNAGFGTFGPLHTLDVDTEAREIQLNVVALVRLTHAAAAEMVERGRGGILNVSSLAGFQPGPSNATYSATKAAVNAFHEALRQEVRTQGVRVSVIEVDKVATGFGDRWPTALRDEAERAWRAAGFKFHGEPVSVADVADVVSFVVDRRPAVALNVVRVQPAIEEG